MKSLHRILGTSLSAVLLTLCLVACTPLSVTEGETKAPISSPAQTDDNAALRTYYEGLISELKAALLEAKEADYISRAEYEARIAALEAELAALENTTAGGDIPVSGDPETPRETTAHTAAPNTPAVAAFQYRVEDGCVIIEAYTGTETHVTIPAHIGEYPVTRIDDDAFRGTAVRTVVIPQTVQSIGWLAFSDCASLLSVTVPASVTSIEYGAFDGCPLLTIYCPKDSYASRFAAGFGLRQKQI